MAGFGMGGGGGRRRGGWGRFGRPGRRMGGGMRRQGQGQGQGQGPQQPAPQWMQALVGAEGTADLTVDDAVTASRLGTGDVDVLATPMIAVLAERAAVAALQGKVPSGQTTVGAGLQLRHEAPTPMGAKVTARARVEAVEATRIRFQFEVSDPAGPAARGMHVRAAVNRDQFLQGAAARKG